MEKPRRSDADGGVIPLFVEMLCSSDESRIARYRLAAATLEDGE